MNEKVKVLITLASDTFSENFPSASVTHLMFFWLDTTDTPGSGVPLESKTVPVMTVCWADAQATHRESPKVEITLLRLKNFPPPYGMGIQ